MPATVDEAARKLIEQHGTGAVYAAVERLNQSIDERDRPARDFWAQVVMRFTSTSGHSELCDRSLGESPANARASKTRRLI